MMKDQFANYVVQKVSDGAGCENRGGGCFVSEVESRLLTILNVVLALIDLRVAELFSALLPLAARSET